MTHPTRTVPVRPAYRVPSRGAGAYRASRAGGAREHAGVDLPTVRGRVVVAPEAGVIEVARSGIPTIAQRAAGAASTPPWTGYGPGVVLLRGRSGVWHLLSHVMPVLADGTEVAMGARVADGTHLAHVHWEVRTTRVPRPRAAPGHGVMDPAAWLAADPARPTMPPAPCAGGETGQ